ncbi:helix-turn-helix domain-containing protein [Uliginosibacterium sp. TH139]|uniref:helix-turn-helix domain-containing protein n=1 Tax=Uliginosibacterium sp. TH139 TaxID=2067453 RepID=UPI000C7ACD7F|nr:helix-turn-helix transcriptional regulator [Uliginosibacterium sp. TH139]PLK48567.1 transcriptional regulator [Uliginosibacterium sp. TH139]
MLFVLSTSDEISLELARRLREHRLVQNMTHKELAERAGLSKGMVAAFEKTGKASLGNFIKLVMTLGLVAEFNELLVYKVTTIKQMEALSQKRQRARGKR